MKAFIISLSKIESSIKSANEVLSDLLGMGFDAELFEGTYGNDAVEMFNQTNRQFHDTTVDGNNKKYSAPGVKGCFMSHYRLWQKCVELNEDIAIFEDDVVFYKNYSPVEFNEVLVISINYDWKVTEQYRPLLEHTIDKAIALDYTPFYMPGCSGYVLKPATAKKLVETYATTYLPADWAINNNLCNIKLHSHLIGRSKTMKEKESLTRFKGWIK